MRILAEEVTARDLKPGDLFSMAPQSYWDTVPSKASIGERVYIRTEAEADSATDADAKVFRITVLKSEHKPSPDDYPPGWVTGETP